MPRFIDLPATHLARLERVRAGNSDQHTLRQMFETINLLVDRVEDQDREISLLKAKMKCLDELYEAMAGTVHWEWNNRPLGPVRA